MRIQVTPASPTTPVLVVNQLKKGLPYVACDSLGSPLDEHELYVVVISDNIVIVDALNGNLDSVSTDQYHGYYFTPVNKNIVLTFHP